jgi:hypothetical protein
MRAIAAGVPVAYPHDGGRREAGSGIQLAEYYRHPTDGQPGLNMLREHATWPEGGYSTEVAIAALTELLVAGKFKVSRQLTAFFDEYRSYHRRDKEPYDIVKINDDMLSALFKVLMMRRAAKPGGWGEKYRAAEQLRGDEHGRAIGTDFDLFDGRPFNQW